MYNSFGKEVWHEIVNRKFWFVLSIVFLVIDIINYRSSYGVFYLISMLWFAFFLGHLLTVCVSETVSHTQDELIEAYRKRLEL